MKTIDKTIIGAVIITLSVIIIGVSGSYAFFSNSVEEKGQTGVNVTSGNLVMNFATEANKYINTTNASLIKDDEVLTKADYTEFSVKIAETSSVPSANYNLYLTEIKMTDNFKSEHLKWSLYKNGAFKTSGDFKDVVLTETTETREDGKKIYTATNIDLLGSESISGTTVTDTYKLYVWLSYSDSDLQNDLLKGYLSAKVAFRGVSSTAPSTP